jgi:type IV secretory pathway TrbF-like protein
VNASPTNNLNGIALAPYAGPTTRVQQMEAARQKRADGVHQAYTHLASWRGMALCELALIAGLVGVIAWMFTVGAHVELKVIRVDQFGQEQPLESAPRHPMKPAENVAHDMLQNYLEHLRPISESVVVFVKNWDWVKDYTTSAGMRQLHDFRAEQDKRQRLGRRVQVTVGAILPVDGATNTYTAEWREEAYDRNGQMLGIESGLYKATLRIADFQSTTAQVEMDLRRKQRNFRNLMGVYVDELRWNMRPLPPEGKANASAMGSPAQ